MTVRESELLWESERCCERVRVTVGEGGRWRKKRGNESYCGRRGEMEEEKRE